MYKPTMMKFIQQLAQKLDDELASENDYSFETAYDMVKKVLEEQGFDDHICEDAFMENIPNQSICKFFQWRRLHIDGAEPFFNATCELVLYALDEQGILIYEE